MYSGSRGILYTAPPAPDGSDDQRAETETPAELEDAGAIAATDGAAADD